MGPVNSDAINQYEQVVTQTLTRIAQQIPTASSSNRGIDYITNTRELLNRIKQLADSGLSQLQRLDAQYVKCALLGKPYEGINIDQALAGVAAHAADQAKLPTVLGNLLTSYVDDLEFQRTHTTIQEVLGSNEAAIAAREERKAAIKAVLTAIKDIRNGHKPEIDQELKKHVIELHSVPGIEEALAGATTAQLDVALTFLQEECHALRALAFPKGAMLVLGHMHKLGTFAHLERLSFSGCNLTDGMVHVLAEKLPSLRALSIAECKGVTEAAFTTQDAHGRLYAERFRQLTSLRLDSPGRISDLGMIAITTHMRELTDLQLKGCALHNGHITLITESLLHLLHLDLSYNPQLTDAAFTARNAHNQTNAAHLSGLLTLDLRGSPLTDQTLLEIAYSMPKLTTLGLPLQAQLVRETAHTVGTKLKNLSELRFAHNDYYRESLRSLSTGLPALFGCVEKFPHKSKPVVID